MLLPDPSIDVGELAALIAREADEDVGTPSFEPVGGDSWNYRAGEWWVSVRRDRQRHVPACYEAARELRDNGLEFVLAPIRGRSGQVVLDLRGRPVVVSRHVSGTTSFPDGLTETGTSALRNAVDRLHAATVAAPVPHETFDLPFEAELDAALARAQSGATAAGPLGAEVAALLDRNGPRIDQWRDEIRSCQKDCRAENGPFVLTHAEPAPPNVMITDGGELLLLDWGDLLWAPPERDARGLAEVGIVLGGRPHVERFYELRWTLGEVAEYADRLTRPHEGNAEDLEKRRELGRYLP